MSDQNDLLKQVFTTPDGKTFETKREAQDYLRRPKIMEAMTAITDGNTELADWLVENQDGILDACQTGAIRRVSKSERNQLEKALAAAAALNEPKLKFLVDNADAITETFRWPTVKRMTEEEKAASIKAELVTLADGNEDVADFIIERREEITEAYTAGKIKRELNAKTREGLARYQAERKAEKEAAEKVAAKTKTKK